MRFQQILTTPMTFFQTIIILGFLVLLLILFYPRVESFFIFYPDKVLEATPADCNLTFQEIFFETPDHLHLHGWYFPGNHSQPVILFCHGNAGNISHRLDNVRRLVNQDLRVFLFDYRGYGRSEGNPSEKGIYTDGLAAYDYLLKGKHLSPEKIVLFGRSLGGAVATEIALKRKVRSLILESAFTSTRDMARTIPLFRIFTPVIPRHFNNLKKLSLVTVPKLIIHGTRDEIVPFSQGRKLFTNALPPKHFFPLEGAGHNDTYIVGGPRYFQTISTFARDSGIPQDLENRSSLQGG
ncbi:MAG: alpha/beta hydrolase [Deltaproteobacteria bacterium]|nr:MAG: alpha/beta hydrolase [Deltaproteobacteria bacterium]